MAVDVAQRWWPIMAGIYGAAGVAYARFSTLFSQFGWIDAMALGFVAALILTTGTLALFAAYRMWRIPPLPVCDRDEFFDEEVALSDLLDGGDLNVAKKRFTRCVIVGPGRASLFKGNSTDCSGNLSAEGLPDGSEVQGVVNFVECDFHRCYFQNIVLIGTSTWATTWNTLTTTPSLEEWRAKRWHAKMN